MTVGRLAGGAAGPLVAALSKSIDEVINGEPALTTHLWPSGGEGSWLDLGDLSTLSQDAAGATPVTTVEQPIGLTLDKSGRNTPASQTIAAARPALSARKNLLTKTDALTDAAWAKSKATVTLDAQPPTLDGVALNRVTKATASDFQYATVTQPQAAAQSAGTQHAVSTYAKAGTATRLLLEVAGSVLLYADIEVDLLTGAVTDNYFNDGTGGTTLEAKGGAVYVQDAGNGIWRCGLRFPANAAETYTVGVYLGTPGGTTAIGAYGYAGGVQWERGSLSRYQRVNTAADYDWANFPLGARFGGDDYLLTPAGGGGSAGFFYCAAFVPGLTGVSQILWSDRNGFTGYRLRFTTGNLVELSAGNGIAYTSISSAGSAAALGVPVVITAWDDGTNLNVQLNQGPVLTVARPAVVAGTASFTEGRDNGGSTSPLTGLLLGRAYRKDGGVSAAVRNYVQRRMAAKAGVTL